MKCKAKECQRSAKRADDGKLGFCSMHYQRYKKHGDPDVVNTLKPVQEPWFLAHKDYSGNDCLRWPFHIAKDGYGRCHVKRDGRHTLTTASRRMLEVACGPAPTDKHECAHSCGNGHKGCVNPKHLRWATPAENHSDKIAHGTTNRGERQGGHKLKESDVLDIVERIGNETMVSIASRYGVDQSTVSNISTGKRWSWLTGIKRPD